MRARYGRVLLATGALTGVGITLAPLALADGPPVVIRNQRSELCLTPDTASGTTACPGDATDPRWRISPAPDATPDTWVVTTASNPAGDQPRCLDTNEDSVYVLGCDGGRNQTWHVEAFNTTFPPEGVIGIRLVSAAFGGCLQSELTQRGGPAGRVSLHRCDTDSDQQWNIDQYAYSQIFGPIFATRTR
ncbi:RICIN domain-containing protein [Goodfellowiella coeruleoviolacea]|uniref:Ricin-type beta-trefoil lectin domain n=1 Tax=Goodfellowiella coeruleoviolacea TaxID=334858 RepID=A0AAE3GMI6_9PSEU|nr:hypothetical protein [Goodfellowiella coeruleoviolacea]MCP2170340.1 Ricin-type beta-trefoil lectin domain [Goodfellowiella coeruleoviolacea]